MTTSSGNPWARLPHSPPFVLDADEISVLAFNRRAKADHRLRFTLLPGPFAGDPAASIVFLGLNPGVSKDDAKYQAAPAFRDAIRHNLVHAPSEYPFYFLNPDLSAPGCEWWRKRLSSLLKHFTSAQVARSILCIDYFPYPSRKFHTKMAAPSQEYGISLVRRALSRSAIVIILRGFRKWTTAIPELLHYDRRFSLSSYRCSYITERNCPGGFSHIMARIGQS